MHDFQSVLADTVFILESNVLVLESEVPVLVVYVLVLDSNVLVLATRVLEINTSTCIIQFLLVLMWALMSFTMKPVLYAVLSLFTYLCCASQIHKCLKFCNQLVVLFDVIK